jgi:large subunit ribosomal protein L10
MKIQAKEAVVTELTEKLRSANAFYLTDFTGLNVKSITDLRRRLRKAGVEYLVVKNTLAERALHGSALPDIAAHFRGPTALVIGHQDPVTPAKVLSDFAREHDNRPVVKAGIVERRAVTAAQIDALAKLPPREELLAQLAGALAAPLAQLAYVLQAKLYELAGLLEALRAAREPDATATPGT